MSIAVIHDTHLAPSSVLAAMGNSDADHHANNYSDDSAYDRASNTASPSIIIVVCVIAVVVVIVIAIIIIVIIILAADELNQKYEDSKNLFSNHFIDY